MGRGGYDSKEYHRGNPRGDYQHWDEPLWAAQVILYGVDELSKLKVY